MRKAFFFLFFFCIPGLQAQVQKSYTSGELQLAIKKLNTLGSVLFIAAHPDDENTRLLSYLANEKMLRTGYLSITRGDGGQNLIGTEQAEMLGVIRTQELLAARKIDGAEQFFTRAVDFGYSKTPEETFSIWGKERILADVVWVIRNFKPDIIIARFPATGEGGHGHHTASAILAEEAFDAAADPKRFPEQLKYVEPWKAKRLYWNRFIRDPNADVSGLLKMDAGVYNPLLGKSYGEIAAESRSKHKSQGFGTALNRGEIPEYFKYIKGEEAKENIFEGIDLTWNRVKGSAKVKSQIKLAYEQFKPEKPDFSLMMLMNAYEELNKLEEGYWKEIKKKELEEIILACGGIWLEAAAADYSVVPGENIRLRISCTDRRNVPAVIEKISFPGNVDTLLNKSIAASGLITIEKNIQIPVQTPLSIPYWLKEEHDIGAFATDDLRMAGTPENKPEVSVVFHLRIQEKAISIFRPVMYKWVDPVEGELYRKLEVIPPVAVNILENTCIFYEPAAKTVQVMVKAGRPGVSGKLKLNLPQGWLAQPASADFALKEKEEEQVFSFRVTPPAAFTSQPVQLFSAEAEADGKAYTRGLVRINYKHIPIQTLFPRAKAKLVPLDLKKRGNRIGYIPGAGDEIPRCLKQTGYDVTILTDETLESQPLSGYDAIITGIRVYNTNERMRFYYNKLMDYVKNGGTLIVQYNTSNFLGTVKSEIGPYPFKISRNRITVEEAPLKMEVPDHPVFNFPNKITAKDFEGWVQERGLYFASDWDKNYITPLSGNDPGENPSSGSLIVAKHGKGYFMYTGLSFFRQLPAGVPGAYRLLVNMISMGK